MKRKRLWKILGGLVAMLLLCGGGIWGYYWWIFHHIARSRSLLSTLPGDAAMVVAVDFEPLFNNDAKELFNSSMKIMRDGRRPDANASRRFKELRTRCGFSPYSRISHMAGVLRLDTAVNPHFSGVLWGAFDRARGTQCAQAWADLNLTHPWPLLSQRARSTVLDPQIALAPWAARVPASLGLDFEAPLRLLVSTDELSVGTEDQFDTLEQVAANTVPSAETNAVLKEMYSLLGPEPIGFILIDVAAMRPLLDRVTPRSIPATQLATARSMLDGTISIGFGIRIEHKQVLFSLVTKHRTEHDARDAADLLDGTTVLGRGAVHQVIDRWSQDLDRVQAKAPTYFPYIWLGRRSLASARSVIDHMSVHRDGNVVRLETVFSQHDLSMASQLLAADPRNFLALVRSIVPDALH